MPKAKKYLPHELGPIYRSVTFPPDVYAHLRAVARKEDRKIQNVIIRAIRAGLALESPESALESREEK